jgi:hypothetical protein
VETALADKADKSTTYTKGQVDTALATKLNKSDVDASLSSTSTNPVQNKAIQAPLAELIDNGAKNLLKITATSQTINGVTFSVNDDGTITANGTATADNVSFFVNTDVSASILRSVKFTGCPAGGSDSTYQMILEQNGYPYSSIAFDRGSGYDLSYTGNVNVACYIQIKSGITVNNLVFKPMICTAEDWAVSHKFAPYAPTNRELYATINPSQFSSISAVDNLVTNIMGGYTKVGKIVILNARCTVTTGFPATWTKFASGLPRPLLDSATIVVAVANNQKADIVIMSDGTIASGSAIANNTVLILSAVYISQ